MSSPLATPKPMADPETHQRLAAAFVSSKGLPLLLDTRCDGRVVGVDDTAGCCWVLLGVGDASGVGLGDATAGEDDAEGVALVCLSKVVVKGSPVLHEDGPMKRGTSICRVLPSLSVDVYVCIFVYSSVMSTSFCFVVTLEFPLDLGLSSTLRVVRVAVVEVLVAVAARADFKTSSGMGSRTKSQ